MNQGAVALLDVLGWKGIWTRREHPVADLLNTLKQVRRRLSEMKRLARAGHAYWNDFALLNTEILLLSDTIVIAITGAERHAIELASHIAGSAIAHGIRQGLPMRGAIASGEFYSKGKVFVGPAVDEVASWYEQTDWMGAILCPSADLAIGRNGIPFTGPVVLYKAPVKGKEGMTYYCVDWTFSAGTDSFHKFFGRNNLSDWLRALGPITPDLSTKIWNTMNFYDTQSANLSISEKISLSKPLSPEEREIIKRLNGDSEPLQGLH